MSMLFPSFVRDAEHFFEEMVHTSPLGLVDICFLLEESLLRRNMEVYNSWVEIQVLGFRTAGTIGMNPFPFMVTPTLG
jgi:hypothetical protein